MISCESEISKMFFSSESQFGFLQLNNDYVPSSLSRDLSGILQNELRFKSSAFESTISIKIDTKSSVYEVIISAWVENHALDVCGL